MQVDNYTLRIVTEKLFTVKSQRTDQVKSQRTDQCFRKQSTSENKIRLRVMLAKQIKVATDTKKDPLKLINRTVITNRL